MKILTRYMLKEFWSLFLLYFLSFLAIFVIVDIFDKLDDLLQYIISAKEILIFYLNFIPPVVVQIIPIAILLAAISLFRKLACGNEYVAMVGGGFSLTNMLTPLIISVLLLECMSFFIEAVIVPKAYFNQERIKVERFVKADVPSREIKSKIRLKGRQYQKIYIEKYHIRKKTAEGITIIEGSKENLQKRRIMAEKAVWDGRKWIFEKVTVVDRSSGYVSEKTKRYPILYVDIPIKPVDLIMPKDNPEIMSFSELRFAAENISDKQDPFYRSLRVEYHRRFAFSFIGFIFLFLSVPFGLMQKRGPKFMSIGMGVVLGLLYYIVFFTFLSFGKGRDFSPFLAAWSANVIFVIFAFVMMYVTPK